MLTVATFFLSSDFTNTVIELLVIGLFVWLILWAASELGAPAPLAKVLRVVLIVLASFAAINLLLELR